MKIRYKVMEILIDNGADIHYENDKCLFRVTQQSNYDIVKLLIDKGAKLNCDRELLKIPIMLGNYDLIDNGAICDRELLKHS